MRPTRFRSSAAIAAAAFLIALCVVAVASAATAGIKSTHDGTLKLTLKGKGSVSAGITHCAKSCSVKWAVGTQLTLLAAPAKGYIFAGWVGSGCRGIGGCTFTMGSSAKVTAPFTTLKALDAAIEDSLKSVRATPGEVKKLLKSDGTTVPFRADVPGKITYAWDTPVGGKPHLFASGSATSKSTAALAVKVKLTSLGRSLLEKHEPVIVKQAGSFRVAGRTLIVIYRVIEI